MFAQMTEYDRRMSRVLPITPSAMCCNRTAPLHPPGIAHPARALGIVFAVMLLAATACGATANAGWLTKVIGVAEHAAPGAGRVTGGTLDRAARHLRALPGKAEGGAALAAEATQEGHWRFINKAGETFTAGTSEELKRVASVLLPDAKPDGKLTLYVTEDTVFRNRAATRDLPKGTELFVVVEGESYRILGRGDGTSERLFAEIRPGLVADLADHAQFREAVWQLARPLDKASVRVLALEPGGPPRLASTPRIDPATKRAMVDTIDPASLSAALGSVRGQTLLVTGRVDGRLLYIQPSTGAERSLLLPDLFKAAEEADVNLVVLRTASTPRQPGGRNWLWLKVQVKGLDQAMQRARVADFLGTLAGANGRMVVTATSAGRRTVIAVKPASDLPGPALSPMGDLFTGIASDITGRVATAGIEANLRSSERQSELDQRLIPGIPSDIQIGYFALVLLGLFGAPVSRSWWRRLWPPETASDYAGASGYWAARIVRGGAFLLLFLPLTAPVAAPLTLARQAWDMVTLPARLWRRFIRRQPATAA